MIMKRIRETNNGHKEKIRVDEVADFGTPNIIFVTEIFYCTVM